MRRIVLSCFASTALICASPNILEAQEGPRPGTIKSIDRERGTISLIHDGGEAEYRVTDATRLMDEAGKPISERLNDRRLKEGSPVYFKQRGNDSKTLMGMRLRSANHRPDDAANGPRPAMVRVDTSSFKPLDELGTNTYRGFQGGFYPGGANQRPSDHEKAGLNLASQVTLLDAQGRPADDGKIALLTIGMSNTMQASDAFKRQAEGDAEKNPRLVIVNGALGGMSADRVTDADDGGPGHKYWSEVDLRLKAAGVSRAQVQAVWMKQALPRPTQGFPKYAQKLRNDMAEIVRILPVRFPNVKLCYLSPRTYGGYAKTPLNPEPYASESGFAVKWLVEQQLQGDVELNFDPAKGPVKAPWLSWGANLWANGMKPNSTGLQFEETDFAPDGTHESPRGQRKVGQQLLHFFKTDATTRPWFVRDK